MSACYNFGFLEKDAAFSNLTSHKSQLKNVNVCNLVADRAAIDTLTVSTINDVPISQIIAGSGGGVVVGANNALFLIPTLSVPITAPGTSPIIESNTGPRTQFDTAGGYNSITGVYTVGKAGRYAIRLSGTHSIPATGPWTTTIRKNGVIIATAVTQAIVMAVDENFAVGDTITVILTTGGAGMTQLSGGNYSIALIGV